MPFQSEKQRRYLWANEPEIARDWADTYGSRVENNAGGINRLGFANGPNWQVAEEDDDDENYLEKFISMMQGNAGKLSKEDIIANKNFIGNMQFSPNNPYAMTSGLFKGMNAPGTSALGSKTSTEMAQKWLDKYGGVDHKTSAMQEKKANIRKEAGLSPHHSYSGGGRIGFEAGSKDYLDFKKWFDNQQQMGKEQSIHDLYEQYEREKRDKKVYDQKHMAATGGIMRLGFANGPAGGASAGGDYGGNVNPEQEYAGRTFAETYGSGNNQGQGQDKDDTFLGLKKYTIHKPNLTWGNKFQDFVNPWLKYETTKADETDETDETKEEDIGSPTLGSHLLHPDATANQLKKDKAMAALYAKMGWKK